MTDAEFKKLPWNFSFHDIDLIKQANKTNIALGKLDAVAMKLPNSKVLIEFISIKEGVKSNAVENINTTVADAFVSEVLGKELASFENKETLKYKDAIITGFEQLTQRGGIGYNDILAINAVITGNHNGIYSSPNKFIKKGDAVLYTPPVGKALIEDLLRNYEKYLNEFEEAIEVDALLKLPLLHYQFEAIHPFGDGNGRTGRVLIILYLVLHKKLSLPILFLSDFINTNKEDYYKHLHLLDLQKEEALKEFTLWLLKGIEDYSGRTQATIEQILEMQIAYKKLFKEDPELKKIYSRDLIDYLFIRPIYSIETLLSALPQIQARQTASKYLQLIKKKGLINDYKHKNNKFFFNDSFLKLLT